MQKNRYLNKTVSKTNFYKIKQFLSYKCKNVKLINRFFSDSEIYSFCKKIQNTSLHRRIYKCSCGLILNKDLNAARNILAWSLGDIKSVKMKALALNN